MATATAAANDAARAHPAPDGSGAGGAEATMTRDSTWWLNTIPDPARFVEIAGWFIVVGAAMSLLGFLLPWSRVVIGASTNGGYFDGWGLASPTHLFVFIGLLAVLALAIRRRPVPAWISSGILGLVFGGLLLGLAWPYLVGPLGADVGLTHGHARWGRAADRWRARARGRPVTSRPNRSSEGTAAERRLRTAPCYTAPSTADRA